MHYRRLLRKGIKSGLYVGPTKRGKALRISLGSLQFLTYTFKSSFDRYEGQTIAERFGDRWEEVIGHSHAISGFPEELFESVDLHILN